MTDIRKRDLVYSLLINKKELDSDTKLQLRYSFADDLSKYAYITLINDANKSIVDAKSHNVEKHEARAMIQDLLINDAIYMLGSEIEFDDFNIETDDAEFKYQYTPLTDYNIN